MKAFLMKMFQNCSLAIAFCVVFMYVGSLSGLSLSRAFDSSEGNRTGDTEDHQYVRRASYTSSQSETATGDAKGPLECLEETDVAVDWNKNGDPPVVKIMFEYQNKCKRPVQCRQIIESGHRPSEAGKNDYSKWDIRDALTFKFSLEGGETKKFLGTLWWHRTSTTVPGLRWVHVTDEANKAFLECTFPDMKPVR